MLLNPKDKKLPPLQDVLKIAEISQADIDASIESWKANPPDPRFKDLLTATQS